MTYSKFAFYNVMGGILWVLVCAGGGYLFGEIPVVKQNFSLVAIAIVVISLIPMAVEVMRQWRTAPPAA
jgi:membrane-associated protein